LTTRQLFAASRLVPSLLLAGVLRLHAAEQNLSTVRAQHQVTIYAGTALLSLTEVITVEPTRNNPEEKPGTNYFAQLIIRPLWIKQGDNLRPAFRVLKPRLNLSHGRIRRFILTKPDGESLSSMDEATPDCAYVLTLDFGHVVPRRFTVTLDLATGGITRDTELTYFPSNDGQPVRSGPTESTLTQLRVYPDPGLQPWKVVQGDKVIPRVDSATVRLDREVDYTIRFAANAE
jgi:hypothetical protein